MELTTVQDSEVRKIMAEMDCPEGFRCYQSAFEDLAPVRVVSGAAIECLVTGAVRCEMSLRFGTKALFCKCPLRLYVAKNLGK